MFHGRTQIPSISPAQPPAPRPFSLLRWFSLLSLACIATTSVAASLFMSNFLSNNMLSRDAVLSQEFVSSIAQAESAWLYFEGGGQGAPNPQIATSFNSFLAPRRFKWI